MSFSGDDVVSRSTKMGVVKRCEKSWKMRWNWMEVDGSGRLVFWYLQYLARHVLFLEVLSRMQTARGDTHSSLFFFEAGALHHRFPSKKYVPETNPQKTSLTQQCWRAIFWIFGKSVIIYPSFWKFDLTHLRWEQCSFTSIIYRYKQPYFICFENLRLCIYIIYISSIIVESE